MLTLVLGGAASGKSEYAEALVLRCGLPRYYLATMQVWDAPPGWKNTAKCALQSSLRPSSARCI